MTASLRRGGRARTGITRLFYPAQPRFAPIDVNRPRTEPMILAHTGDLVKNDAVAKIEHSAGLLIDDLFNGLQHPGATPAVGKHLDVEDKPSILIVRAQRRHDLVLALHFDQVSRLQPQGVGLRTRTGAPKEWVWHAIDNTQPSRQYATQCLELIEQKNEQAADHKRSEERRVGKERRTK